MDKQIKEMTAEETADETNRAMDGPYRVVANWGTAHGTYFIPVDSNNKPEQVELADGRKGYFGLYLVHDLNSHPVGTIINTGGIMYTEGTYADSKAGQVGNHIHCEVFIYTVDAKGNVTVPNRIKNSVGVYYCSAYMDPSELFVLSDYAKVVNLAGQTFGSCTLDEARGGVTPTDPQYNITVAKVSYANAKIVGCVDGNKYGTTADKTGLAGFGNKELVAKGAKERICINGSIFYPYGSATYAEGIEKSKGVNNQELGLSCVTKFADTMAIAFNSNDGTCVFEKQKTITDNLEKYTDAITGAFGIMKDGVECTWGKELESQRNFLWTNKAGRTIFGRDVVNKEYVIISIAGETGKSGPTGPELFAICKANGCTDAIELDGSGSRKLRVDGKVVYDAGRLVKNAVLLYEIPSSDPVTPTPTPEPTPVADDKDKQISDLTAKVNELTAKVADLEDKNKIATDKNSYLWEKISSAAEQANKLVETLK